MRAGEVSGSFRGWFCRLSAASTKPVIFFSPAPTNENRPGFWNRISRQQKPKTEKNQQCSVVGIVSYSMLPIKPKSNKKTIIHSFILYFFLFIYLFILFYPKEEITIRDEAVMISFRFFSDLELILYLGWAR